MLGISDADTAENHSGSKNIVIAPVSCALPARLPNGPKLSGRIGNIQLRPGSRLEAIYQKSAVAEEFFCNYEVNPEFEWAVLEAGFSVVARGLEREARAIESPRHRFFIATLFQPQLSSRPGAPHPIIREFLRAATEWKAMKLDDRVLN